jgi:rod shape-determining protein MreB
MFHKFLGWFSNDLAIDLGTANTLVFVKGKGIVCNEPSVVAVQHDKVIAVGTEAQKMLGRTPANIHAMRPLKEGVIADFDKTGEMLKYFIRKVHNRKSFISPRIAIGVPSGITQVEQRAVKDAAQASGAREIYLVEEPMAAALGVGLPIGEPSGNMIVDIGGGTTDVAVISLHGVVYSKAVRMGGDKLDEDIVSHIKSKGRILIGERTAEQIKRQLGSAFKLDDENRSMDIKGRDLVSGIPKTITIYEDEIRDAISETITVIMNVIKVALENTPPELASDIVDRGIVLAGGGALLKGLDALIRHETDLPVIVAEEPLLAVVNGVGKVLDDLDILKRVSI